MGSKRASSRNNQQAIRTVELDFLFALRRYANEAAGPRFGN